MSAFLFGSLGALAVNLVRIGELAQVPRVQRPATITDPYFCVQFLGLPLIGGFLAYVYAASGTVLSPILAVNIGVSAPLILKNFAAAIPPIGRKID